MDGFQGYLIAFDFKVAQKGCCLFGYTDHIDHRVDVFNENGAQVAYQTVGQVVVGCMASSQNQGLAVEDAAFGVVFQIQYHGIGSSFVVGVVQAVFADGNEFAFVVRGAG